MMRSCEVRWLNREAWDVREQTAVHVKHLVPLWRACCQCCHAGLEGGSYSGGLVGSRRQVGQ